MKRFADIFCDILLGVLLGLLFLCFVIMASGCKTQVRVVERVRVDSVRVRAVERDSIYLRDSVFVMQAGDTIRIEKWRTHYVERLKHDTLQVLSADTIPVPVEVIKEVKYIPKSYKVSAIALWVLLALAILYGVIRLLIKIYLHK